MWEAKDVCEYGVEKCWKGPLSLLAMRFFALYREMPDSRWCVADAYDARVFSEVGNLSSHWPFGRRTTAGLGQFGLGAR